MYFLEKVNNKKKTLTQNLYFNKVIFNQVSYIKDIQIFKKDEYFMFSLVPWSVPLPQEPLFYPTKGFQPQNTKKTRKKYRSLGAQG
jgi:hypothetical protein